eukprot:1207672-Prymnesium_polylepis.1
MYAVPAPALPRRLACPRRRLAARTFARRPASAPRQSRPPVTTPGCPVLGVCVWGGARPHCPRTPCGLHPPCALSPDPVTTPGRPVPGGC